MAWAYEATAVFNGKPAGYVGTFLDKEDYKPYPRSLGVRWKRVSVNERIGNLMKAGHTYVDALKYEKNSTYEQALKDLATLHAVVR